MKNLLLAVVVFSVFSASSQTIIDSSFKFQTDPTKKLSVYLPKSSTKWLLSVYCPKGLIALNIKTTSGTLVRKINVLN